MSTFQGTEANKKRIEQAIGDGMKELAAKLWPNDFNETNEYDPDKDPEEIREHVRTVVWLLVYRGWFDFR